MSWFKKAQVLQRFCPNRIDTKAQHKNELNDRLLYCCLYDSATVNTSQAGHRYSFSVKLRLNWFIFTIIHTEYIFVKKISSTA